MLAFWSAKGGVGTTTTAVLTARAAAQRGESVLLVDLGGDVAAVCGVAPNSQRTGDLIDWPAPVVRVNASISLIGAESGAFDDPLWTEIRDWERSGTERRVVADLGTSPDPELLASIPVEAQLLVLQPCYLAARRSTAALRGRAVRGLVVVRPPGRVLTDDDLASVCGIEVVAAVAQTAAVARAVDAGLLLDGRHGADRAVAPLVA
jgi:hypothetical protein